MDTSFNTEIFSSKDRPFLSFGEVLAEFGALGYLIAWPHPLQSTFRNVKIASLSNETFYIFYISKLINARVGIIARVGIFDPKRVEMLY